MSPVPSAVRMASTIVFTSFGHDGRVDLRVALWREARNPLQTSNPGRIFENLIIISLPAQGAGYESTPADVQAYDVRTGKIVWVFHSIPHPGEFGYDTWPEGAYKKAGGVHNAVATYDADRIRERASLIGYGIDARRQRFPDETPFVYQPHRDEGLSYRWDAAARAVFLSVQRAVRMRPGPPTLSRARPDVARGLPGGDHRALPAKPPRPFTADELKTAILQTIVERFAGRRCRGRRSRKPARR